MTKNKRILLLTLSTLTIPAVASALYWKRQIKSQSTVVNIPKPSTPEPIPAAVEPELPALSASTESMPKMGVAQGRKEHVVYETDSSDPYPVFTHTLCKDGTIRSLHLAKAVAGRMNQIFYQVEGLTELSDMCVLFRGYDPATIQLVKGPDIAEGCKTDGHTRSCARANWQLCDEERGEGTRWCQFVEILPDLEARIFTKVHQDVCEYQNVFIYKGREIVYSKEKGVYGETQDSKFRKIVECTWEGADGEYGDSSRFADGTPSTDDNNLVYLFSIGPQRYFLYHLYGMEGDNWDIHELKDDSIPAIVEEYFYAWDR